MTSNLPMNKSNMQNSHDEIIASLPWLVNGSLNRQESRKLQNHVDQCAFCQQEVDALKKLHYLQNQRSEPVPDTQASLQRMRERIVQDERSRATKHNVSWWISPVLWTRQLPLLLSDHMRLPSLPTHSAIAASVLVAAAVLMLQGDQSIDQSISRSAGHYHVLSSGESPASIDVYVQFDPSVSRPEVDQLLKNSAVRNDATFTWSRMKDDEYKINVTVSDTGKTESLAELSLLVEALKKRHEVLNVGLLPNLP